MRKPFKQPSQQALPKTKSAQPASAPSRNTPAIKSSANRPFAKKSMGNGPVTQAAKSDSSQRMGLGTNLIYTDNFVSKDEKAKIVKYLTTLHPIWENRFSEEHLKTSQDEQRSLLRPVYWLGNWQFACLNYYHPPKGIEFRCVSAEAYPPVLRKLVDQIEKIVRAEFDERDIPKRWHLNTCLINYYGDREENGAWIDTARVGEHKDFEPGPVGSISFGDRALFQFVKSSGKGNQSQVVLQQWLDDSSLQIFGGEKFKNQLFHRVQRVESKGLQFKDLNTPRFRTRRINFTFRYVPSDHVQPMKRFPENLQKEIQGYVNQLAARSEFWKDQISGL